MDKKEEILPTDESNAELSPELQSLADMAGKMEDFASEKKYNKKGFDADGIHKDTGTKYNPDGYDIDGFSADGRDRAGYDRDGYDIKGFDRSGVDKEGFDRRGFGTDWRDREGYNIIGRDKDGYDRGGFDRRGVHRETGTKRDPDGYDRDGYDDTGYDRNGFDRHGYDKGGYNARGFNRKGVDREGYNRRGFNSAGYNREGKNIREFYNYDEHGFNPSGVHFFTRERRDAHGFNSRGEYQDARAHVTSRINRRGFDIDGHNHFTDGDLDLWGFNFDGINSKTGNKYDEYGFDANGWYYDRTPREHDWNSRFKTDHDGVDRRGFRDDSDINIRTGTLYDKNGFDKEGYNEDGFDIYGYDRDGFGRDGIDQEGFGRDGFNADGIDRDGFDRDGFNMDGVDREGYNKEGLDKDGNTREFNAKFNEYGVDENGYHKNGEIDPDVEFAINFAESGIKSQGKYAEENNMDEKDVRKRLGLARKKCPNIDEMIRNILLTGNKMLMAAVNKDCEKVISGEMETNDFWDKHPKLAAPDTLNFINDTDKKKQFADKIIDDIEMGSDNIEKNLRVFGVSFYDVPGAIKGAEEFKKIYTKFGANGLPEKRENIKKIYDVIKYFNRYKNHNIDSLLGFSQSFDGGKTWIEFDGETIGRAMEALKKDKKLICVQSVKDYIIKENKENKNE